MLVFKKKYTAMFFYFQSFIEIKQDKESIVNLGQS